MAQANLDLGVLQDKKFTYGVYTCESSGYSVVSMAAPIQHYGGVSVFYRVLLKFSVKALQQFQTNIVRLKLVIRERQW